MPASNSPMTFYEIRTEFKRECEENKKSDPEFAKKLMDHLAFIYNNPEWPELTWKRYPSGKIYSK